MNKPLSPESEKLNHRLIREELRSFLEMDVWSKNEPIEQREYAKAYRLAKEIGVKLYRYPETIKPTKEELQKANEEHEEFMKRPVDPEEVALNKAVFEAQRRLGEFCRRRFAEANKPKHALKR
jgi:hypothetical protein